MCCPITVTVNSIASHTNYSCLCIVNYTKVYVVRRYTYIVLCITQGRLRDCSQSLITPEPDLHKLTETKQSQTLPVSLDRSVWR